MSLSDAVLRTLNENPSVRSLKEDVAEARGRTRTARGQFDWTAFARLTLDSDRRAVTRVDQLSQLAASGFSDESVREQRRTLTAGMVRQNRSGILFQPSLTVLDVEASNAGFVPAARSDLNMTVVIPLRRGRGREVVGATEKAAQKTLESTELRTFQAIAARVLATVVAHFDALAARQSLELSRDIFARAERLAGSARDMIRAGHLEPAFLHQAEAKLANNRSDLVGGENGFYASRQSLGLSMGLGPQALRTPPLPDGTFPEVIPSSEWASIPPDRWLDRARARRPDYQAIQVATQAELALLTRDRNATRSQVDLGLRAGYAGLGEDPDSFDRSLEFFDRTAGANAGFSLTFGFPVQNNTALGAVESRRAAVRRLEFESEALLNQISASCLVEAESVKNAAFQFELVQKAVADYAKAVEFEWGKYRSGNSSLNLVIDLEDRYVRTRLAAVEAIRRYSVALARLAFATGTILRQQDDELVFAADDLYRGAE